MSLVLFRVYPGGDTRLEVDDDVLGWGVEFPSGLCIVDWAGPVTYYEGLRQVEETSGGNIEIDRVHSGPGWHP